ncbi:MAG TPA: hypothetical protein VE913_00375 [Longimicrobium sp.]|nr:hypothetical protein [Longimicrobium sp.]
MKYCWFYRDERAADEDEMVKRTAEQYTFASRPVLVRGDAATAGFSAKRIDALPG